MATYRTVELVLSGTGQKVYTYPEEWTLGVPTAATLAVYKGDQSMNDAPEFAATVTIDAVSTTFAGSSGPSQANPRQAVIASAASIDPGVMYLAENLHEQRELVAAAKIIAASGVLLLENDLRYDYENASTYTLKGVRMDFTVDATWVANANKILLPHWPAYKAVWTYIAGAITRRSYTYVRLVRQLPKHNVTLRDLQQYWPDLVNEEPRSKRGQQFTHLIEAAYDDFRRDLVAVGRNPDQIRDTELTTGCVIKKCLHLAALYHGIAPGPWAVEIFEPKAKDAYEAEFGKHFGGVTTPKIDESTDGGASTRPHHPTWFSG